MASHAYILLVLVPVACVHQEYARDGIIDHLSNGMKMATSFLGSESVALKVAEFVVRAFQNANNPHGPVRRKPAQDTFADATSSEEAFEKRPDYNINEVPSPMSPLKHIVKLFGLRPNQISAVAVNALVFVAQMISTFLSGPKRSSRPYRAGEDPTSWILNKNSRSLQDLISSAKNTSLVDNIENIIQQQGSEEETSCIQLLICKITPFVSKMQKTVFGNGNEEDTEKLKGSAVLYRHLPSADEINATNDVCERKHRDCNLNEV